MKVGDLVKISLSHYHSGIITRFKCLEDGKKPNPVILVDGKEIIIGKLHLEVVK